MPSTDFLNQSDEFVDKVYHREEDINMSVMRSLIIW